jgi:cell division transport system permease protein
MPPLAPPKRSVGTALRTAAHLAGEGCAGLAIAPGQATACVLSLAVAACLVTLAMSFGSLAGSVLERAARQGRLLVYLKDEVSTAAVEDLLGRVRARPDVERVDYLSREQDRARNAALLPRDVVAGLPADAVPGQQAIEVIFRDAGGRAADVAALAAFARSLEGVDVVAEPPIGAERLRSAAAAVRAGRAVLSLASLLLLACTVLFVVGTLTRTMERRREEMAILRLVGATDGFIRAPLFVQGLIQGVAGVVIGAVAGLAVGRLANAWLAGPMGVNLAVPLFPAATLTAAVAVGAGVGALGAFLASLRRLP